jgi:transcriptional regulator with XRE-family HTH domain
VQKGFSPQLKQFGAEIKRLREAKSLTQQELAYKCDVDIRTIQRIETGEYGIRIQILFALAVALELTPSELLAKIKLPVSGRHR